MPAPATLTAAALLLGPAPAMLAPPATQAPLTSTLLAPESLAPSWELPSFSPPPLPTAAGPEPALSGTPLSPALSAISAGVPALPAASAPIAPFPATALFEPPPANRPGAPVLSDLSAAAGDLGAGSESGDATLPGRLDRIFHEGAFALARSAEIPTGPAGISLLEPESMRIDGLPYRLVRNDGRDNRALFALTRDGGPRMLKALYFTERGGPGMMDEGAYGAVRFLRGASLGALFGAPAVRRSGILRDPSGQNSFFLEYDELFPGKKAASLKALHRRRGDPQGYGWLAAARPDGGSAAADMGTMMVQVFDRGVVPEDADFFVAEDGGVAWIDADHWNRPGLEGEGAVERMAEELKTVLRRLSKEPTAVQAFRAAFLAGLDQSPALTPYRDALLKTAGW